MDDLDALLADLQTNLNKVNTQSASPLHHHTSSTNTATITHQQLAPVSQVVEPYQSQHFYQNEDSRRIYSTQFENGQQNGYHHHQPPSRYTNNDIGSTLPNNNHLHTYQNIPPPRDQMYRHEMREEVRTETRSSGPNPAPHRSPMTSNLSELDSLLQDLNTGKQNSVVLKETTVVNGSRPSVDSLLDELNSVGHREAVEKRSTTQETRTVHQSSTAPANNHKVSQVSASNATKELDDLMESLSDFKINASSLQTQVDSAYAKPLPKRRTPSPPPAPRPQPEPPIQSRQKSQWFSQQPQSPSKSQSQAPQPAAKSSPPNQLDSMLGSLTTHMTEQGITTSQKGCCCACDKPIVGQVITALGKTWHPEHFTCTHCKEELGTKNFFERDGKPYCEPDYHSLFSPKCAYCSGPILDKCVTAMNKTWHPEHFFCAQCGNTFGEEGFHEKNGKPYCKEDYFNMFAPKCGGCNNPIMENYISALNGQWHPECFVCRDCNQPFNGGCFFDHEGLPYCETHYHAKRGSLCAACNKPITGRCITAMFRKYHPEHFLCAFCLQQLNKGTFKEQNNKPYCHTCFDKLYG